MSKNTYETLEKKIARCLAQLPSERLRELATTKDQINSWLVHRQFQKYVSLCWQARHTGKDDPIRTFLKSKQIDLDIYDSCWLLVDHYEQLWGLIQLAYPYIRAEFDRIGLNYAFASAFELFVQIIAENINSSFSVCLKPYHEVSQCKHAQLYQLTSLACKTGTLNSIELKKMDGLLNQYKFHTNATLIYIALAVCHSRATRRTPALKSKLEMFYATLSKLCDKEVTISRKASSYAWNHGEMMFADKGGSYAKKPETL